MTDLTPEDAKALIEALNHLDSKIVVACRKVSEMPPPKALTDKVKCHVCKAEVWLSYSTVYGMMVKGVKPTDVVIACEGCAHNIVSTVKAAGGTVGNCEVGARPAPHPQARYIVCAREGEIEVDAPHSKARCSRCSETVLVCRTSMDKHRETLLPFLCTYCFFADVESNPGGIVAVPLPDNNNNPNPQAN